MSDGELIFLSLSFLLLISDTVKVDISLWIQRGIWPLSSYTPSISQTTLKGFEDYSQEEVRWQAVIATSQRNSEAYVSTNSL